MQTDTLHILPSSLSVLRHERDALLKAPGGTLGGTRYLTLPQLAERIAGAPFEGNRIEGFGKKALLASICRKREAGSASYAGGSGTLRLLLSLIEELRAAGVSPRQFDEATSTLFPPLREKYKGIAELYGCFEAEMERLGLCDQTTLYRRAIERVSGGFIPPVLQGVRELRVSDIYDLTWLQVELLGALARVVSVFITLPWDPSRASVFGAVSGTLSRFEALGGENLRLEVEFDDLCGTDNLSPLRRRFLSTSPTALPSAELPRVITARGHYPQCEAIGREVRLLLDDGVSPTDIFVAFRDLSVYGPMMEDVFRRYRIPLSFRRGMPLAMSPLVKAALAVFEVIGSRFEREEMLRLLKSGYFEPFVKKADGSPCTPEEVEGHVLQAGIIDDREGGGWEQRLRAYAAKEGSPDINALREGVSACLLRLKALGKPMPVTDFGDVFRRYLRNAGLYRMALIPGETFERDARSLGLLEETILEIAEIYRRLGDTEPVTAPQFYRLLLSAMEGKSLGSPAEEGVAVLSFHDLRGLSAPRLFLGGLNEGEAPAPSAPDPLMPDTERQALNSALRKKVFRATNEQAQSEPLLFAMALAAGERITFSWSCTDISGRETLPSFFLRELGITHDRKEPAAGFAPLADAMEPQEVETALFRNLFGRSRVDEEGLSGALTRLLPERLASLPSMMETVRREALRQVVEQDGAVTAGPFSGRLSGDDIRRILRERVFPDIQPWSATAMEQYAACPYVFFSQRVLGILEEEKPSLEMERSEEGSLVHAALREGFQRLYDKKLVPLTGRPEEREVFFEAANQVIRRWEEERSTGNMVLWQARKKELLTVLGWMLDHEPALEADGFIPSRFEAAFGDEASPMTLTGLQGEQVALKGRIDRIDLKPDGLRVVDYKHSSSLDKKAMTNPDTWGVSSFQLPVYLMAAKRLFPEHAVHIDALIYLLKKYDKPWQSSGDPSELLTENSERRRALMNEGAPAFIDRAIALVERIRSGEFAVWPMECPDYCDYRGICRYEKRGEGSVNAE
ncbi:MAG: PD-(D/E)XK nuclease family protein [Nitrospirota bacterium]|nr:PD-(D/E)XK nuclease family protein [Nitrospirota bacterium]